MNSKLHLVPTAAPRPVAPASRPTLPPARRRSPVRNRADRRAPIRDTRLTYESLLLDGEDGSEDANLLDRDFDDEADLTALLGSEPERCRAMLDEEEDVAELAARNLRAALSR